MRRADFFYRLPAELIAQRPTERRGASRLLVLEADPRSPPADRAFPDLRDYLRPGDLLVLNDTRVIPARLFARKASGGRVEILVDRLLGPRRALCQLRSSKKPTAGTLIRLEGGAGAEVLGRQGELFELDFRCDGGLSEYLEAHGHVPLPPYIRRQDDAEDRQRYQTVYARAPGAVAAPTAGLHFESELLAELSERGVRQARVTLHVGAGTFQPVRSDDLGAHRMHAEWLQVGAETCQQIVRTRERGGRVVAVGTTVVRALETAAAGGSVQPYTGETRLFITPGYRFRSVDALLTNFHLPESTLLMLVCAFAGHARVMAAYEHAVVSGYRFFSYGDAMLLFADPEARCASS